MAVVRTWANVAKLGLKLPETAVGTSYGTPALKVKNKMFVRLKEDSVTIVLLMDTFEREHRLRSEPDVFYITDHYKDYPAVLVRLAKVEMSEMKLLLEQSWRRVAPTGVAKLMPIRE